MLLTKSEKQPVTRTVIATRVLTRLVFFVVAECWLNAVNLDTLADYHEFMQGRMAVSVARQQAISQLTVNQLSFNAPPILVS